jgi:hypothetical protein
MPALTYWPQLFNAEQCQASIHTFRWKDVRWVVYLYTADKYDRLTCRSSENQKDLDARALTTSQWPLCPWCYPER